MTLLKSNDFDDVASTHTSSQYTGVGPVTDGGSFTAVTEIETVTGALSTPLLMTKWKVSAPKKFWAEFDEKERRKNPDTLPPGLVGRSSASGSRRTHRSRPHRP